MPREKSSYRERRSSSYSSESSYERKKYKSKYKRRSRSRDRSVASSHKSKSSSHKHRKRSYSRSLSRDRYESRSRRRSSSRSRSKRSRRSHSRSSSRGRSRHGKSSKKSRRRSRSRSSSSRSGSFDIEPARVMKSVNLDDTETKVEQAIKAAEAAGLTMTKIPTYEYPEVEIKEDMPTIHDRNLLAELNSDSFVQKPFISKSKKQNQNIVIDLDSETVQVPTNTDIKVDKFADTIIDVDEIPSEEELRENWIKKLYQYRKRMLRGEI